ncbi:ferredoxin [Catenulispora sp. NL8]|uniref:Ferredoxin n=1 Tax=Catenulispora pinistramenti TaxID=2705254 RepID=A0ABS5KWW5_9ACTN|nr:ferredoxin [Catenulispora pinistramenti]MBS2550455.1 ferredoxin [Catenulispora pinistramenti]
MVSPAEDVKLRVVADRSKCMGAGMCALNAPEVFDQDEQEGLVVVLEPEPSAEHRYAVRDAVNLCPASALRFEKDEA